MNRLAAGRKHGNRRKFATVSSVDFTGCTRMLETGVPLSVVATIMGWSPSTTVRMSRRYGHTGQSAQRQAVDALKGADFEGDGAQNWAHSQKPRIRQLS